MREEIEQACRSAARSAAPVFAAHGWTYGLGKNATVPSEDDLYSKLIQLARISLNHQDGTSAGSGRFSVTVFTERGSMSAQDFIQIDLILQNTEISPEYPSPYWD